jgi:hypothetical protein
MPGGNQIQSTNPYNPNTINTLNTQNTFNQLDGSDNLDNLTDIANPDDGVPGSGVTGQDGPVPDSGQSFAFGIIVNSLAPYIPAMSSDGMLVLIAEVEQKLHDTGTEVTENSATTNSLISQGLDKEQQAQLAQAQQQIEAAAAAQQNAGVWAKVEMAFQIIAAVVMIAVGAVLAATGVGAPLAALMIVGGVATLMSAINGAVQTGTGHGFIGDIAKACGDSDQQAQQADMGFGIAMAVIGLACSVATFFLPSSELDMVAEIAVIAGDVTNAVSQAVTAEGDVFAGVDAYNASQDNANADDDNASAKELAAFSTQINAFIKMILGALANSNQTFDSTLSSITAALQRRDQSLIQAAI